MKTSNIIWTRPPGPPIIWSTVNAKEKLNDNIFTDVRLSIQDIPEDRHEDALNHMCQYFLADEVLNKCLKTKSDAIGVNDNRLIWQHSLKQGMCIGAFKLESNGELGELIGMNIVLVSSDEIEKRVDEIVRNSKSSSVRKIYTLAHEASDRVDIRKVYGVDKYIFELGLSVKPTFRGQKLGVRILETWTDIGRMYGISAASIYSTGPSSRIVTERAGFKTALTIKYGEVLDENGQSSFPSIESDALRLMIKQL